MSVKAKFYVCNVERRKHQGGDESRIVTLTPFATYESNYIAPHRKTDMDAEIKISLSFGKNFEQFELGKTIEVEFTPID